MDYRIDFQARDLLYFGDGHLADGSSLGNGANWPLPSLVNSALITALHNSLEDDVQKIESRHEHFSDREKQKGASVRYSFGGVQSVGPFPVKGDEMYVPTPADLQMGGDDKLALMKVVDNPGVSNLPKPLTKVLAPAVPPSKKTPGNWISLADLQKYLNGNLTFQTVDNAKFFSLEPRIGIGINPETQTTVDGKFYSAEYLRLEADVALRVFASYTASGYQGKGAKDMMETAMQKNAFATIMLGGQTGLVFQKSMEKAPLDLPAPRQTTRFLKWILLTPAIFPMGKNGLGGWCPGFLDAENGKVRLKRDIPRGSMTREEWRKQKQEAPDIDATLVAARIPKHQVVSGWKLNGSDAGQPKPTRRLVPAGSVFYFECADEDNAAALHKALHARSRSDECGEQGFGFGVCGYWQ